MIGHEKIISMRKRSMRPKAIWVWVGTSPVSLAASWHLYTDFWAHPEVDILPKDRIEDLDLRFSVGIQVHIDGNDTKDRIVKVHRAFSEAGAEFVVSLIEGTLIYNKGKQRGISAA